MDLKEHPVYKQQQSLIPTQHPLAQCKLPCELATECSVCRIRTCVYVLCSRVCVCVCVSDMSCHTGEGTAYTPLLSTSEEDQILYLTRTISRSQSYVPVFIQGHVLYHKLVKHSSRQLVKEGLSHGLFALQVVWRITFCSALHSNASLQ